jgi:hypothetical protein
MEMKYIRKKPIVRYYRVDDFRVIMTIWLGRLAMLMMLRITTIEYECFASRDYRASIWHSRIITSPSLATGHRPNAITTGSQKSPDL